MNDLIYNQRRIPKEQWRYGMRSSAATGCGWIATYNALRLMGYRAEPEALIRFYERQLPLIHGNCGTTTLGPALAMRHFGFPVEVVFRRDKFDQAAKNSDVSIVFYHWRKKWKLGAHFVTVRHDREKFIGYNTYRNSQGPDLWGESMDGFLKKHGYFGCVLIAIRDKRNQVAQV